MSGAPDDDEFDDFYGEDDLVDILARESIEGLTKHQPKGKSRYGNQ